MARVGVDSISAGNSVTVCGTYQALKPLTQELLHVHCHTITPILTHSLSHLCTYIHITFTRTHTLTFTQSHSHSHLHNHTHTHIYTITLTLTFTQSHSHTLTHTHSHVHTHTLTLSHYHTITHTHSHSLTHSLTHSQAYLHSKLARARICISLHMVHVQHEPPIVPRPQQVLVAWIRLAINASQSISQIIQRSQ
jgi:hypothetical protein